MKVIIVGGVAGGATAAARLRRLDENVQIIMIERSGFVSYANCGLPYYVGGTITDRSKLTLQTPQSFRNRFNIDARVRQEVVSIDRAAHTVTVRRLDDGTEYVEGYDKLILSPGARPVTPDLPGIDAERLFTLRTVEDTYRIAEFIERRQPRRAVVVGAGFIGLEMAENLRDRGVEVTVVQRGEHVMPVFDADMASLLHNHLREQGVELLLKADVTGFEETSDAIVTALADGRVLESDLVMLSIGVAPESTLAREAGLELGLRGSIKVDAAMRTSDPDIYAVGDAVEVTNVVTGSPALIALAGPANKQGRIAADNICGLESEFGGSQGSSVLKLFELDAVSTGLTLSLLSAHVSLFLSDNPSHTHCWDAPASPFCPDPPPPWSAPAAWRRPGPQRPGGAVPSDHRNPGSAQYSPPDTKSFPACSYPPFPWYASEWPGQPRR